MSVSGDTRKKPDCVVIDTNIWRSKLLLKTPTGASLVYTLGRQGGFLGLPEVIERELPKQIVECGIDAARKLKAAAERVNTLMGSPFSPSLPTVLELEKKVAARIAELEPILVRVPFTFEHAKAALDMVIAEMPPNRSGNQQFKDSAIWQAVLTLSMDYSVHLVTMDHAFLRDSKDPMQGLAENLLEDCRRISGSVDVYGDLGSCLKAISCDVPPFDREKVTTLIVEPILPRVRAEAESARFEVAELLGAELHAFRTRRPNIIAVDYAISFRAHEDPSLTAPNRVIRINCQAVAYGSCYYDLTADSLDNHFLEEVRIRWDHLGDGGGSRSRSFDFDDPTIPFRRSISWS